MRFPDRLRSPGVMVTGLCLLAFGLRVARLDFHPIWFDEDLAYQRATAALGVSLASMAGSPLYYVLLRGWVELTGVSLFALRYFSTLFGTLAIPLVYRLTHRLLGSRAAIATAAVSVAAPFYIYYSQEARTYTLTLVLMLVSMSAFLRWLDRREGWTLAACCLANLICLYTHYVAALVILAQGILLLLIRPIRWKDSIAFVVAHAGVGLAFLPWLWRVWKMLPRVVAPPDSATLDAWSVLARTWTEFSIGRTLAPPLSLYLAVLPLFLALVGLLSVIRDQLSGIGGRRSEVRGWRSVVGGRRLAVGGRACMVILVWLIVPIVGSLLVPRASVRFSPKYLIAVTPVYYTLIVLGLAVLRKESRVLFWMCVIALAGISLYSLGDYYVRRHDKLAEGQKGTEWAALATTRARSRSSLDAFVGQFCQQFFWGAISQPRRDSPKVIVVRYDRMAACRVRRNSMRKISCVSQGSEKPSFDHLVLSAWQRNIQKPSAENALECLTRQLAADLPVRFGVAHGNDQKLV